MFSHARAKTTPVHWLLIAVLLVVVLLAPAAVATSVTSPDEPVEFWRSPQSGWRFTAEVVTRSIQAEAASPGSALRIADEHWGRSHSRSSAQPVTPTEVALLYLPAGRSASVEPVLGSDKVELQSRSPLAWQVLGRVTGSSRVATIGLIDFSTGRILWDATRTDSKDARTA